MTIRTGHLALAGWAIAAALSAAPASATIFYANYTPSNTPLVVQETPIPNDYRLPSASQSFSNSVFVGAYCADAFCSGFSYYSATTSFTPTTGFTASNVILPVYRGTSFGNFRIGIGVDRFDAGAGTWTSIGGGQFESGNVPAFTASEIVVPFGTPGAQFVDFSYQPITFTAGSLYRMTLGWGTGALGDMQWYVTGTPTTPGQATQYYGGGRFSQAVSSPITLQPAFALTDGGALTFPPNPGGNSVPEPATWGLMLLGFGLAGAALRRRGGSPARA